MKSKQIGKGLVVSILLALYYQQITAARTIKGSKAKNITTANPATNQTLEINGENSEINKTTTTAVTIKPELNTTVLPADFEVDGRHAFINNQFVAEDEEPFISTESPSNTHRQHSYTTHMEYDPETPHIKEPVEGQKLPSKPISAYNMGQLHDYEDDETSDYVAESDAGPENCEDTQESLIDNNYKDAQLQYAEEQPLLPNEAPPSYKSKLFHTSNSLVSYGTKDFAENTNLNPGLLYASKPAQFLYQQTNAHKKHLQHSGLAQQHFFAKSKPIFVQTADYNMPAAPQSYRNPQTIQQRNENYNNPQYSLYDKVNFSNDTLESVNQPDNLNASFMPDYAYDNANVQTTAPFSATTGRNKKFKTVSSSIQYVSTPLATLVFKYSIGVAKRSNSKAVNTASPHEGNTPEARNYINDRTE